MNICSANISTISNPLVPQSFLQSRSSIRPSAPSSLTAKLAQPTSRPSAVPARQKIWERDNYGWKRGYYLTNISLRRPREWLSKGWSGERGGRIGEARGYSYTSGPIKYNSSVQHWLISQRGGNSFRVFKSSFPTLFSKEKHPIARISRGGARSNILLPSEEI